MVGGTSAAMDIRAAAEAIAILQAFYGARSTSQPSFRTTVLLSTPGMDCWVHDTGWSCRLPRTTIRPFYAPNAAGPLNDRLRTRIVLHGLHSQREVRLPHIRLEHIESSASADCPVCAPQNPQNIRAVRGGSAVMSTVMRVPVRRGGRGLRL